MTEYVKNNRIDSENEEVSAVARPKRGVTKEKLNLSVSKENKYYLTAVANHRGKSISQLVEEMAEKEYRKDCKSRGEEFERFNGEQEMLEGF